MPRTSWREVLFKLCFAISLAFYRGQRGPLPGNPRRSEKGFLRPHGPWGKKRQRVANGAWIACKQDLVFGSLFPQPVACLGETQTAPKQNVYRDAYLVISPNLPFWKPIRFDIHLCVLCWSNMQTRTKIDVHQDAYSWTFTKAPPN